MSRQKLLIDYPEFVGIGRVFDSMLPKNTVKLSMTKVVIRTDRVLVIYAKDVNGNNYEISIDKVDGERLWKVVSVAREAGVI